MRQGARSKAPARADGGTAFVGRNQLFGGAPRWAISPYLENGSDDATQNARGNLNAQTGSNTGVAAGLDSNALSVLGSTYTNNVRVLFNASISGSTMTVHSISSGGNNITTALRLRHASYNQAFRIASNANGGGVGVYTLTSSPGNVTTTQMRGLTPYTAASGAPAVNVVNYAGKKAFQFQLEYDDYDASGQVGRKLLIRNSDNADELANGLDAGGQIGETNLYAFSMSVNAASVPVLLKIPYIPFFELSNSGSAGQILLTLNTIAYSDGGVLGNGAGPNIQIKSSKAAWVRQVRVIDNYPADTPMHFVLQVRYGIAAWVSGNTYGPLEEVQNAGNVYSRDVGGANNQTAGATPPTHGSGSASDGTITWNWVKATPAGNVVPFTKLWTAVGNAAFVDAGLAAAGLSGRTNYLSAAGITQVGLRFGWYETSSSWTSGEVIASRFSEMTVAQSQISLQTPNDAALTQWFSALRDRF